MVTNTRIANVQQKMSKAKYGKRNHFQNVYRSQQKKVEEVENEKTEMWSASN